MVVALAAVVAIPAALTLVRVDHPARLTLEHRDPTPMGYTWSLLLFVVPLLALAVWFTLHREHRLPKRAFWRTIWTLTPLGFGLDFFFGARFLDFGNPRATLGWNLRAVGGVIPIEEYVFYLTGFLTILLLYLWADEYWLSAYNVADYAAEARQIPRLVLFHPESLIVGVLLLGGALAYKKLFSMYPEGFPGYFAFLIAAAFVPSASLLRAARPFINWRAFSFTMYFVLLVSLLWEVTLAIPYRWWGYNMDAMIGLTIGGWWELPIEAVCVWLTVTYTTVIVYEVTKIWQASGRPLKEAMLGPAVGLGDAGNK